MFVRLIALGLLAPALAEGAVVESGDGLRLELVAMAEPIGQPWAGGPIPAEYAIRGFHSVTISEEGYEKTASLLGEVMGFKSAGSEQNRFRYRAGVGDGLASRVDLLCVPDARHGDLGAGVVHHVAFRIDDGIGVDGILQPGRSDAHG